MVEEAALVVRGTVTDSSNRPVAGARVALVAGPVELADVAALTGDDGSFAFGVPRAGRYRVEAYGDSGMVGLTIDLRPDQAAGVRLVLPN
jgi:Carboxypeptidase regulatory-like domain